MHWYLTRSTDISQDLLRSHKIYWYGKIHLTFDIRTFTFYIWHLTLTPHFTFNIYWDLTRSTDLASYIWHLTLIYHDIWHWYTMTFDIDIPWHLTFDMTEGTDSTSTDTDDIDTILSHFHWWILRLSLQSVVIWIWEMLVHLKILKTSIQSMR